MRLDSDFSGVKRLVRKQSAERRRKSFLLNLNKTLVEKSNEDNKLYTNKCRRCGDLTVNRFNCPKCLNKYDNIYNLEVLWVI